MELDELLEKTNAISPTAGFSDRVMHAVKAERPSVLSFVPRAAKRFVPIAAIAAAAAIVWAVTEVRDADDVSASTYDAVDTEW